MIQSFQRALQRRWSAFFKKPTTVSEALRVVVPEAVANDALASVSVDDAIEYCAHELFMDSAELLTQVAEALQLSALPKLTPPSKSLLKRVGHSEALLQELSIVPQRSIVAQAGYLLAVSDPTVISVAEFESRGIPVVLSSGAAIRESWKAYRNQGKHAASSLSKAQLVAVMKQIAIDALACGGSEVFIGHPSEDRYEFIADDKRYSGQVHPDIYHSVLALTREEGTIRADVESSGLSSISIALTRNFERPVACLSWETPRPAAEAVESKPKSIVKAVAKQASAKAVKNTEEHFRILLVDDDPQFSKILSRILESKGWHVDHAENGKKALVAVESDVKQYQLIVSDVHMPELDGPTFLREIRQLHCTIPVVMLTSDHDQLLEAELALLGADAFVRKQEDPKILLAWCSNLLTKQVTPTEHTTEFDSVSTAQVTEVSQNA